MSGTFEKIKNSKAVNILKSILSSKYFPFAGAAVMVLCYYLSWDIVAIYYIGITGALTLLLLDDVTPVISNFLFICVFSSLKNTPFLLAGGGSDYYFRPEILGQIIFIAVLFISSAIYRFVLTCIKRQFKVTPMFTGMCALCAVLLLNGVFAKNYDIKNLVFGGLISVCLLSVYIIFKDSLKLTEKSFENIAFAFIALSALLIIELFVIYVTKKDIFINGKINRATIIFGWGVYNTYGLYIVMCIPAATYLAAKKKFGFGFTIYSLLILAATVLCCSRQAMLGAAVIYPLCIIIMLVKGKSRLANLIVVGAAAVAGIILACVFSKHIYSFIKEIMANIVVNGTLNGSGRWSIWQEALYYFESSPVFGAGFFVKFEHWKDTGNGILPHLCHNTVLQIMCSCGVLGIVVYAVHRVQTAVCFFKNVTPERTFIAIAVLGMLLLSLLDTHIFNILPTILYSFFMAVLDKSQKKVTVQN